MSGGCIFVNSEHLAQAILIADLLGVFFFAESGALLAARRRFDLVGSLLLATMAGLGGGLFRDIVLNQGLPNAFARPIYLLPVVVAVLLVYVKAITEDRWRRTILAFDAAGLALFCVSGTMIAFEAGAPPVPAALLGASTAVVGGLLRDVVSIQVPFIFDQRGVYAIPALFGAAITAFLEVTELFNLWTALATIVLVFSFRMTAWHFKWMMPGAVIGQRRDSPLTQPIPITRKPN